jgi:hypothetical protein
MIRSVELPYSKDSVYRALKDPILLAGWLNLPYVSTGYGPLHLFELEDWNDLLPWKVRGFMIEDRRGERILIEKDEVGSETKPTFDLTLDNTDTGCRLGIEWEDAHFDRAVEKLLDPRGHLRLGHLLGAGRSTVSEAP